MLLDESRNIRLEIDWEGYYKAFKLQHGEPILFDGRLLFPDGWRYALDFAGPEFPPKPKDLPRLQRVYWRQYRLQVAEELDHLRGVQDYLLDLQAHKSVALPVARYRQDERTTLWKLVRPSEDSEERTSPLGEDPLGDRIANLVSALEECDRALAKLESSHAQLIP